VGYEKAAEVVKLAQASGLSLWEAGRKLGISEEALAQMGQLEKLAGA
jgi:fumarate hydratase class II